MKDLTPAVTGVILSIIGLAVVAVIVSNNANTSGILKAGSSAFSQSLRCALGPVIGGGNCGTATSTSITFE